MVVSLALVVSASAFGADWPQWRGPNRDASIADFTAPKRWPGQLSQRWKVRVGEGHSSPVVADGRVYVHARQDDEEVVRCLDLRTGDEEWQSRYRAPYSMHRAARAHGPGPKSTPALYQSRLFTFSINGVLSCFDTKTGQPHWQKDFSGQYPKTSPLYGTAMSPIAAEDVCIAHVGGHDRGALTAFDIMDGAIRWSHDQDGPAYCSPILVDLGGRQQLVTQTQNFVVGVAFGTGELLWKIPFNVAYDENAVTMVVYKDMLIYSGHAHPTTAIRLVEQDGKPVPKRVWSNPSLTMHMSSPVIDKNRLFGMSHRQNGQIFCLDADTGQTLWSGPGRMGENVALIKAGEFLLLLTTGAELIVLRTDAPTYRPVAEYKVADSPTWAHPALVGTSLLIKDKYHLAIFDLE